MEITRSIYIHIPFCETKCPYCDFNTYASIESLITSYVVALKKELTIWGTSLGIPSIDTVFIGGGTPSYLPSEEIKGLVATLHKNFDITKEAEITLESNPDDLTESKLTSLKEAGINRLSIGVQSLNDKLLTTLGRRHSAKDAISVYQRARCMGFGNISLDLMYGLPHQSIEIWDSTLTQVFDLKPDHLSMYCLTLEDGTPMQKNVRNGILPKPDADIAADMYVMAQEKASQLDYQHYEISNWSLLGKESQHNLIYWQNKPFLGVGPGAHSYLQNHRFHNIKSPKQYIKYLNQTPQELNCTTISSSTDNSSSTQILSQQFIPTDLKPIIQDVEMISLPLEMAETIMMGLRLSRGIYHQEFILRFGNTIQDTYPQIIKDLVEDKLIQVNSVSVKLTDKGRILGNEVFSKFF